MMLSVAIPVSVDIYSTEVEDSVLKVEESKMVIKYYEKLRANRASVKKTLYFTTLDEYTFLLVAQRKDGTHFVQRGYFQRPLAGLFFDLSEQEANWFATALKGETFKATFLENYLEYYAGLELYGRRTLGTLHS